MKVLWILLIAISGPSISMAQDMSESEIDVERAIINTDAAEEDAKEAKLNAKHEQERLAKLTQEAKTSLSKAKKQQAKANKVQAQAEGETLRLKAANNKNLKKIQAANEQIAAANKRIQVSQEKVKKAKLQHDQIVDRKKETNQQLEQVLAQTRDYQMQEKEAFENVKIAAQELKAEKARQRQAQLRLEKTRLLAKKRIAIANTRTAKLKAEARKSSRNSNAGAPRAPQRARLDAAASLPPTSM